jgi:hypothetical protein
MATRLSRLSARQAKVAKAGHTRAAAILNRRIARLQKGRVRARLLRREARIEAACHVAAPST